MQAFHKLMLAGIIAEAPVPGHKHCAHLSSARVKLASLWHFGQLKGFQ
jgi:hypothetical protein